MNDFGKLFLTASLIISPWLVAACGGNSGGGSGDDEDAGGRVDLCRSICRQIEECGTSNRQECVQVCQGDELTSTAALQVIDECYSEEGCSATIGSCLTSGLTNLEPGPAVERFCADMAGYFSECSETEFSVVECRSLYGSVASGYLSDVGECFEESCGLVENCIASVTERYQNANGSIIELATTGGMSSTCPYTNDGECDEGTYCDYGTDTADCSGTQDCCTSADNCDWAGDGFCDCGGEFAWDAADCGSTSTCPYTNDGECDEGTYCDYGTDTADCSGTQDCCTSADNCGWAGDGFCDCGGEFAWDAADCGSTSTCPYTNDGECDEGTYCDYGTDTADCSGTSTCPYTNDGECDEGTYCDYGTDTADCSGECCTATDSCGWASDGYCDCGGEFAWDAADCN